MECPKCQAQMEVVQFEEVEVDRCVRCGGLWFDVLEHEELRDRSGAETIDTGPRWQAAMHDTGPGGRRRCTTFKGRCSARRMERS
jgi:uncharacterized protein